jgi:solute carrier family 8 (sodium/calcium exchanger)
MYFLHLISMPWKLMGATIPPTRFFHGKLTFVVALLYIGLVTAYTGDLATLLGCSIGIDQKTTGATFVALGTSLPDLFASRIAITEEDYADNAIGNITGSNSVIVYVGLGLPWLIAALYWDKPAPQSWIDKSTADGMGSVVSDIMSRNNGKSGFIVGGGTELGFNVAVYILFAGLSTLILVYRRYTVGGEAGGSYKNKMGFGLLLVCFWPAYIILTYLNGKGKLPF